MSAAASANCEYVMAESSVPLARLSLDLDSGLWILDSGLPSGRTEMLPRVFRQLSTKAWWKLGGSSGEQQAVRHALGAASTRPHQTAPGACEGAYKVFDMQASLMMDQTIAVSLLPRLLDNSTSAFPPDQPS
ncbi:uncharacterized protein UV8b_01614 [Ustilaginoidea virens]|uniref:Uncharacterized protein n=1 Tax=Ustilaginoidea virens TaxID=1159556 RepID=A0A8E5MEK0_USTVR|nr:uncharacterized protein UV8b_01614 [Ustilaginoidea virens]QUC17373.1 hypothetical protein UV8b_01614 [Ustilaginoidea virens]